jgi:hypothetical protein
MLKTKTKTNNQRQNKNKFIRTQANIHLNLVNNTQIISISKYGLELRQKKQEDRHTSDQEFTRHTKRQMVRHIKVLLKSFDGNKI